MKNISFNTTSNSSRTNAYNNRSNNNTTTVGNAVGKALKTKSDHSLAVNTTKCLITFGKDTVSCAKAGANLYGRAAPTIQKAEFESIKKDPYVQYMLTEKDERKKAEAALRNNLPIPPKPQSDTVSNVVKGALIGGLCGLISAGPLGLLAGALSGALGGGFSTSASVDIN